MEEITKNTQVTPELVDELLDILRNEVVRLQLENLDLKAIISLSSKTINNSNKPKDS
jgi:cell division septum initiation protein DivIVA